MPSFLIKPTNQDVGKGRTATLQCVVTGNPPPTVFWSKGKEQVGDGARSVGVGVCGCVFQFVSVSGCFYFFAGGVWWGGGGGGG